MRVTTGLLIAVWLPSLAAGAETPTFRWLRDADFPGLVATVPVGLPLDSHFFQETRDGWPDVRLKNEAGQPVAFLIRPAHDLRSRTVRHSWPAHQQGAKVEAGIGLQVDLVLRDKEPAPSGLRIITPLRDFEHQVQVESSADGVTWIAAGRPEIIFDYSQHVDARNVSVPFNSGSRRRFRLTIADVTAEQESQLLELHRRLRGSDETERTERTTIDRRPFRIDGIEFYRDESKVESSTLQTTPYPSSGFAIEQEERTHRTIVSFNTLREPITEILVLSTTENFSRAASIEVEREDVNGRLSWQPLTQGTLTRFSIGTIQQEDLKLRIPETRAANYRMMIENRDSPPLEITGVELTGPLYELTFLASPGQRVTMEYGSSDAQTGRYDTAALEAALAQGQAVTPARWKPPRENREAPDRGRAWQPWNDVRVLFSGIVVLTLLLGWGLFRAGRRIDRSSLPEN